MTSESHKVAFYADIFYDSPRSPSYWIPPRDLDVEAILLGGDIHYRPDLLGAMLREIRETQRDAKRIIVVPGNGECGRQELGESRRRYREAVRSVPGAVFLDDEAVVLPSGLRVIGSTLWSLIAEDELDSYSAMLAGEGLQGVDDIRLGDASSPCAIRTNCTWPPARSWPGSCAACPRRNAAGPWSARTSGRRCGHGRAVPASRTIGSTRIASNPRAGDGPRSINPDFAETYVAEL